MSPHRVLLFLSPDPNERRRASIGSRTRRPLSPARAVAAGRRLMTMGMTETVTGGAALDGTHRSSMHRRLLLFACLAACAPRSQSEPGVLLIEEKEQTASFIRNFNPLVEVGDLRWPALHSMY